MQTNIYIPIQTIMVIDDELMVREVLSEVLIDLQVLPFSTGDSAVHWLQKGADATVALALCDYGMPGLNGLETLREIRRFLPCTKRILMSASIPQESLEFIAHENELDAAISKPFTVLQIRTLIRQLLASLEEPVFV